MQSIINPDRSAQENSKCQQCGAHAESMAVFPFPKGTGGNFLYPLCEEHAAIFRAHGPRVLPKVWRDAVLTLGARVLPVATEVLQ
jgi:hypothetical protein